LAILVFFPKGVVESPSHLERYAAGGVEGPGAALEVRWTLDHALRKEDEDREAFARRERPRGLTSLALMLGALFACRARFARIPVPAPRATPPLGVGPGGVRFIERGEYDERCLSAAILGLQSRGYLRVHEHGERLRLERGDNDV